jgi:hypothetical protein
LPQSGSRDALLASVEAALRELERLCGRIERALMRRRWDELNDAIADSRRVMHALQNAMDEANAVRYQEFDDEVGRRLRAVQAIRQNQMSRLQQYHDAVGERLRLISRWKSALRTFTTRSPGGSSLNDLR